MHVTLRQLQVFSAVARHGSFTRAAKDLHLTQPAVSMQVKQLETQAGLPLIETTGKQARATEAGEEVLAYARAIFAQVEDLKATLDALRGLESGRLRISAATTANYFVPILLSIFHARYPGADVSLDVTNRQTLLDQLAENEADMVIMGAPPGEMELEAGAFMENPLVIIAPRDHPFADVADIPLSEMNGRTFLVRETGSGTRQAMERFFSAHGVSFKTGMEVTSDEAIKQSVQAGLGLGFMSRDAVQMERELDRLAILDVQHTPLRRQWYVVHRKSKRLSPLAETFKRFLLDEAAEVLGRDNSHSAP